MDLEEQVKAIDKKVTTIIHLLTGTDLDKSQGFLHQFEEQVQVIGVLQKRIEKLEKWKDRIIWILVGLALPTGYGIAGILNFLLKIK